MVTEEEEGQERTMVTVSVSGPRGPGYEGGARGGGDTLYWGGGTGGGAEHTRKG